MYYDSKPFNVLYSFTFPVNFYSYCSYETLTFFYTKQNKLCLRIFCQYKSLSTSIGLASRIWHVKILIVRRMKITFYNIV